LDLPDDVLCLKDAMLDKIKDIGVNVNDKIQMKNICTKNKHI